MPLYTRLTLSCSCCAAASLPHTTLRHAAPCCATAVSYTQTADATQYQASQENFTAEMTGLSDALKAARLQQRTATRAARAAEAKLQSLQEELKTLLEVCALLQLLCEHCHYTSRGVWTGGVVCVLACLLVRFVSLQEELKTLLEVCALLLSAIWLCVLYSGEMTVLAAMSEHSEHLAVSRALPLRQSWCVSGWGCVRACVPAGSVCGSAGGWCCSRLPASRLRMMSWVWYVEVVTLPPAVVTHTHCASLGTGLLGSSSARHLTCFCPVAHTCYVNCEMNARALGACAYPVPTHMHPMRTCLDTLNRLCRASRSPVTTGSASMRRRCNSTRCRWRQRSRRQRQRRRAWRSTSSSSSRRWRRSEPRRRSYARHSRCRF